MLNVFKQPQLAGPTTARQLLRRVSRIAVAVSDTMNATHARKMNMYFCFSVVPWKNTKVSGIRAAIGTLRPKTVSGKKKALIHEKQPQNTPTEGSTLPKASSKMPNTSPPKAKAPER